MGEIRAKLVRKYENDVAWYFDEYELECIECGAHYMSGRYNSRTNPYCPICRRKHERDRQKKSKLAKATALRNQIVDSFVDDFCNYIDEKYHRFADDERVEMHEFANKWKQEKQER